jgi:hypothetical protein
MMLWMAGLLGLGLALRPSRPLSSGGGGGGDEFVLQLGGLNLQLGGQDLTLGA